MSVCLILHNKLFIIMQAMRISFIGYFAWRTFNSIWLKRIAKYICIHSILGIQDGLLERSEIRGHSYHFLLFCHTKHYAMYWICCFFSELSQRTHSTHTQVLKYVSTQSRLCVLFTHSVQRWARTELKWILYFSTTRDLCCSVHHIANITRCTAIRGAHLQICVAKNYLQTQPQAGLSLYSSAGLWSVACVVLVVVELVQIKSISMLHNNKTSPTWVCGAFYENNIWQNTRIQKK